MPSGRASRPFESARRVTQSPGAGPLGGVERQGDVHGRSTLGRTVDRDLAIVRLDEPLGRGQAETSAT